MPKRVVILGAGFAGLELAARLSDSLPGEAQVTLIDQSDTFLFGYSKLDITFGNAKADDLHLRYRDLAKPGVAYRQECVTSIDPESRYVETDSASYDADILVVALGADYDPDATPGFREGGLEYYSVPGAERLRDALPSFEGGRVVIAVLGDVYKCPPSRKPDRKSTRLNSSHQIIA